MAVEREQVEITSREDWHAWLEANHTSSPGVWLVTWKKATGHPRLDYEDLVEEALCFGWIDSTAGNVDGQRSKLLVTPRKPTSVWARSNKERVERLEAAGLMQPAGLASVEIAKANGSWSALDAVEALEIPDDLRRALAEDRTARRHFEAFPPSSKKMILYWILSARRPETRARRIAETVRLAARNERANHPRPRRFL